MDTANRDDLDKTVQRPPLPAGEAGIITSVPGPTDTVVVNPVQTFGQPSGFNAPPPVGGQPPVAGAQPAGRSGVTPKVIIAIVAVAALIGGGAALFLGGDDDATGSPSDTTVAESASATTLEVQDPSTTVDDATTSSTVIETTVAPTTTSPYFGPGASLVASDPLPSGVPEERANDALPYAQLFADRIADGDWAGVASMVTTLPPTAEQLDLAFGRVDRFSLIVLDAADDGFGVTLQIAGVANESDGTTTVRCLRWTVNPDGLSSNGAYDAAIVAQFGDQRTAAAVLADTAAMDSIRAQCALV